MIKTPVIFRDSSKQTKPEQDFILKTYIGCKQQISNVSLLRLIFKSIVIKLFDFCWPEYVDRTQLEISSNTSPSHSV